MTAGFKAPPLVFTDEDRRKGETLLKSGAMARYGFTYRGVIGGPADPALVRAWFLDWVNAWLDGAGKHAATCQKRDHSATEQKREYLESALAGIGWVRS